MPDEPKDAVEVLARALAEAATGLPVAHIWRDKARALLAEITPLLVKEAVVIAREDSARVADAQADLAEKAAKEAELLNWHQVAEIARMLASPCRVIAAAIRAGDGE